MINLINGDCLEKMKDIQDKSIDLILCDLPYGTQKSNGCKWDIIIPFDKLWEQYNRIIKDDGAIVLFGKEPFSSLLRASNLNMYKYDWIWSKDTKSNFMQCNYQPLNNLECISVFSKAYAREIKDKVKMKYNPQFSEGDSYKLPKESSTTEIFSSNHKNGKYIHKDRDTSKRYPYNTLFFNSVKGKEKIHPTQKPIDLLEYLIKTYTDENDLVLDNCMGSGSTGIACINTNRNFIGIEKDIDFYIKASNRIEDHKNSILLTQAVNVTIDYINEDYEEYDENYNEENIQDFEINCFELPKHSIEDVVEDEIQLGNNYFFREPEQLDKVEFISFKKPDDEYLEPLNSERFENIFVKERFYEEKPLERK
jgi:site-specific DNA-methyltransferase (adenine-specific)